jgi:hypothetical protein
MRNPLLVLALLAAGCGRIPAIPVAAPAACCHPESFREALGLVERHRNPAITERRFTHAQLWASLEPTLRSPALRVDTIGRSVLGREIRAVTFGRGPTRVLLWSQMHGDEATATMSLGDVLRFLAAPEPHALRDRLARQLTVVMVPMLNPDGAELFQRQNAMGIDVNRDARRLVTPEGRALKALRDRVTPHFGFNLHDQSARTRAGRDGPASGIALLPPAYDEAKSYNDVRTRARLVAATLAAMFSGEIPGRVAKYDDTFNPRAFGDLMQTWGTSTVLIESGALPDDPQKQRLRALNAAAILLILDAIATGGYEAANPDWYEQLPFNAGGASDLLVRGGQLVLPGMAPTLVDVAINYEDAVAKTGGRVRDVGDLADVVAIDTLDATGLYLFPSAAAVTMTPAGPMLRIDAPAEFDVRRGNSATSELVRRIGALD